jgi:hypothetical protein
MHDACIALCRMQIIRTNGRTWGIVGFCEEIGGAIRILAESSLAHDFTICTID